MQYSNGTHGAPYCKTGSCYTTTNKLSLKDTKELDATILKESNSNAAGSSSCNPACGQGQSCCVVQYSNGTYGPPYCKTGSCYTSAKKQSLKNAKELDAASLKENK
jgi:hypothetical protein